MSSTTAVTATQAPREQWLSEVRGVTAVPTISTVTSDYWQPVIAVESVDAAKQYLLSFLALANPLYDLRLRISESVLFSKPVENILKSVLRQKRKFAYDRETSVLRLYAMARPLHDEVQPLVSNFLLLQAVEPGFLTLEEQEHISCSTGGVLLSGKVSHANQNRKKLKAWTKYPDTAIVFGDPESDPLASVVFEAGFTESYDDLVGDAKQWLQKSSREVRLVILVNIEEDAQVRRAKQKSNAARKRTRQLLTQFGTAKAKDREGIDHEDSDVESDEEMYDDIRSRIVVEDWVGPITATLEVWHMVNGTPQLRQPPIVSPYYHFQMFFTDFYRLFCPSHQFNNTQQSTSRTSYQKTEEPSFKASTNLEQQN